MDFYHNWVYQYVLNTEWFLWFIVGIIIIGNIASPSIIWLVLKDRKAGRKHTNSK